MGQNFSFRRPRFSIHWMQAHGERQRQEELETQQQRRSEHSENNNAPLQTVLKPKHKSKISASKSESNEILPSDKNEKLQRRTSPFKADARTPIQHIAELSTSRNCPESAPSRELYFVCTPHRLPSSYAVSDTGEATALLRRRKEKQRRQARMKGRSNNLASHELNAASVVKQPTQGEESKSLKCSSCSEPSLVAISEGNIHRHGYLHQKLREEQKFEAEEFLSKCCLSSPGNVPFVMSRPSWLYQIPTIAGDGCQAKVLLPKGMVVKALFKNQHWLYVQTPDAKQGYIEYANCLAIKILLPSTSKQWNAPNDPNKRQMSAMLDTQFFSRAASNPKLVKRAFAQLRTLRNSTANDFVESSGQSSLIQSHGGVSASVSHSPIPMTLQPQNFTEEDSRETLVAIIMDYHAKSFHLRKGEIVTLSNYGETKDGQQWFYVKARDGREGYIPAEVAGHGFL